MRYGAKLGVIPKVREMINVFGGVNRLPGCGENEFAEMSNMNCGRYPRAAAREPRLEVELTKKVRVNFGTNTISQDVGEWEPYEGSTDIPGRIEQRKPDSITTVTDNNEFVTDGEGNVSENPGYGYPITTTTQYERQYIYEYREENGQTERRVTIKNVDRFETVAVRKADDPHDLTFNGEHTFYLDKVEGELHPVMDGNDLKDKLSSLGISEMQDVEHTVVKYGAYFVVFPECVYFNSADADDIGEAEIWGEDMILYLSDEFGEHLTPTFEAPYEDMPIQTEADEDNGVQAVVISEGDTWLTKIGDDVKLFKWVMGEWEETECFITMRMQGTGGKIDSGDMVYVDFIDDTKPSNMSGFARQQKVVYVDRSTEGVQKFIFKGTMEPTFGTTTVYTHNVTVNIRLYVPIMDVVFECGGRLWGCRYGAQRKGPTLFDGHPDGEFVNEIFCTKARSFTQWQVFTGEADGGPLDTDSFVFNVSEAGAFTGGCVYNGVPTFFKKDTMYRVSGSLSSGFSLYSDSVPGVQEGSSDGICVVNGVLYYKASTGVYAYAGGMPQRVSDKLGSVVMRDAVAGVYGHKAVFFMKELGESRLYIYDTEAGAWTIEETDPVLGMTEIDDGLVVQTTTGFYMMSQRLEKMREYDGMSVNSFEKFVPWSCCSGLMGLGNTDKKYVTRIELRYLMPVGSMFCIDVEYDSSGRRIRVGQYIGTEKLETQVAAIRLRRCDHFRLYLEGVGQCEIVTLTRTVEGGSERNG